MDNITPFSPFLKSTVLDNSATLFSIKSSNLEGGAIKSTNFHSTAFFPLIPSALVQKISAKSFLTFLLSIKRVTPPVPGRTPNNGTSGKLTVLDLSSTKMISSHASATS